MSRINLNCGGGASRSLKAFTLAEVLITLAIIGVVAALTIPSVIASYNRQEISTKLKKVVSTLQNTTNLAISEHGPIKTWTIEKEATHANSKAFAEKYLLPYLRVSKMCGEKRTDECYYQYSNYHAVGWYSPADKEVQFYLADGTMISLWTAYVENGRYISAPMMVDINGHKKPNLYGKDIFFITYTLVYDNVVYGKIEAAKTHNGISWDLYSSAGCNKGYNDGTATALGFYCAAVLERNGWTVPTIEQYAAMYNTTNNVKDFYPW